MKPIVRQQFLDQMWDAAHLDAAGEFWLRLYDIAASRYGYSSRPRYTLELQISGFPRADSDALCEKLERSVTGSDLAQPVLTLHDPDMIVLTTAEVSGETAMPKGLGLPLLAALRPEGLVVEIRLRVIGRRKWFRSRIDVAMVVVGELRTDGLLVKALWRSHHRWQADDFYRTELMAGELEWAEAVGEFCKAKLVTQPNLVGLLAPPTSQDISNWRKTKLLSAPFNGPRLRPLLVRFLVYAGMTAAGVFGWVQLVLYDAPLRGAFTLFLPFGLYFLWGFLRTEWTQFANSYRPNRAAAAGQYANRHVYYSVLNRPGGAVVLDSDPAIRKYTADLKSEGFVLMGDVTAEGITDFESGHRVFRAADGVTYLIVSWTLTNSWTRAKLWPAPVSFQAQTFFQGGGQVDSSGTGYGYLRTPTGPNDLVRTAPEAGEPIGLCSEHQQATERFATEKGLVPLRHEGLTEFVQRQVRIYEAEREYYASHPYSWWDHLRWYLQMPRREQRG